MVGVSQMISYVIALGIAAAIPGPGMAALVARSVGGGAIAGFSMLIGLIVGDLIYLSFAVFGLSIIASQFDAVLSIVRWASALYLCYLAWQFWTAKHQAIDVSQNIKKSALVSACCSGLTITLGNPKTIAFYLAILPLVINLKSISLHSWGLILAPLTIFVLLGVGAIFILCAMSARHLLSSQRAQQILFRGAAIIMGAAAFIMLV